jgi:hypothetical protein
LHPHLRPIHNRETDLACGNVDLGGTAETVVVGDGECHMAQLSGARDEVVRMRSTVEEAEVRMCVELCVPCHGTTLIEHMFDSHGVFKYARIRGWTTI